ncbi:nucleotide-binding alpha-beta plait domain-containing protein, partial [Tanacetum coccineum]
YMNPSTWYSYDKDADRTNHAEDAYGTNHLDLKLVKRGITRLYKFRSEYGKPGGIKIKVTFDALNKVSGLHRALFSSFLGDLVCEHIGLKILSWKKVDKESRDKLWDEITRYFDVDLTVRKLEKSARGKMARSKNVYHHKTGRGGYVFVKEKMIKNKEIEADKEPPRGIMWLKGRVNKDGEFTDDEIRLVGDKLKEADDKIKEGTLNLDDGTGAMIIVFGKEKGGYARGVGSRITYKRYFHLPRSRQATNERIELLQTQLDNERRERQQKDKLVKKLSTEMTEKDVTPMGALSEVDGTQSSVVVRDKDARIKKKSKSQGNVSPTQELPTICTVYKSTGKQMLHNEALPNDCYKVSIDSSSVDAACIPDVGNNGLKTVKDGVGGFFAWPKNQVVLDEEVTQPT